MRVDYLGLEAFVAIADYGSFQRAAQALALSQAALSHRLRKLEDDLGGALLVRSSREVSLTDTGQQLLPEARRLIRALQETYEGMRAGTRKRAQRLAFACLPSLANTILPRVLFDMARARPDLHFELLDIPMASIPEAVRSGAAEFGVTMVSAEMSDLRIRSLIDEDYHLFLPEDHPLAARESVTLQDIAGLPLARIRSQSRNRELLDAAMGDMRDQMNWQFEVQNGVMAMRLVSAGVALSILPQSAISIAPVNMVSRPFTGVAFRRTLGTITRRTVPPSARAADLLARIEADLLTNFGEHLDVSSDRQARLRARPRD